MRRPFPRLSIATLVTSVYIVGSVGIVSRDHQVLTNQTTVVITHDVADGPPPPP